MFVSVDPKNTSIVLAADESDDEEFSSDDGAGEEEVDVGGVEDYYDVQPRMLRSRVVCLKHGSLLFICVV